MMICPKLAISVNPSLFTFCYSVPHNCLDDETTERHFFVHKICL